MKRLQTTLALTLLTLSMTLTAPAQLTEKVQLPGRLPNGKVLLPNGWTLTPAGSSIPVGDFPLAMAIAPDGKRAAVVNSGWSKNSVMIVDIAGRKILQTLPINAAWNGASFTPDGKRLIVSGGDDNLLAVYAVGPDSATLESTISLGQPQPKENLALTGVAVDASGTIVYVASRMANTLYRISLESQSVTGSLKFEAPLYSCVVDPARNVLYVSIWGASSVGIVDLRSFTLAATVKVGDHPNEMALTKDGRRLFVANANNNTVSVVDTRTRKVTETIAVSLKPSMPEGSTPNSLALTPDGSTLYVANADNNFVAVIDVSKPSTSRPRGFIPTGWYPTLVRCAGPLLLVANGKGEIPKANPHREYIAGLLTGSLSFINAPTGEELSRYSAEVYENTPLTRNERPAPPEPGNPIPAVEGAPSPIKHVFYIIKENRTYDQVLGDLPEGNGDSSLTIFGRMVTPNHHALAENFVLLDNFYVDAEVSADGHNWSMAAYANDFVEKTWPVVYSGRGGNYVYEHDGMTTPTAGYLWDNCIRHGVSIRDYGEFIDNEGGKKFDVGAKGLVGHAAPEYRGWDLNWPDQKRVDAWIKEFDAYVAGDSLVQFEIIKLPNDHTAGTRKGGLTPRAMVADNDLALGRIVDRISHSPYWASSAIFVVEDDAQNGPDHVDAHRSIAFVISPYVRHRFVDHTMYSTTGLIRTMELILGLPPLSQHDAGAVPMYRAFTATPDLAVYNARPNEIDLSEKNVAGAYGQKRMEHFNLTREDAIPDIEFNDIIWRSVKGAGVPMPAPVRSAFVAVHDDD